MIKWRWLLEGTEVLQTNEYKVEKNANRTTAWQTLMYIHIVNFKKVSFLIHLSVFLILVFISPRLGHYPCTSHHSLTKETKILPIKLRSLSTVSYALTSKMPECMCVRVWILGLSLLFSSLWLISRDIYFLCSRLPVHSCISTPPETSGFWQHYYTDVFSYKVGAWGCWAQKSWISVSKSS